MAPSNSYSGIDEYAVRVVRHHARALVRRGVLRAAELEDAEQEFALDLLQRLPHFDPERATYRTFVSRVVRNRAARMAAATRTEKARLARGAVSLHEVVADAEGLAAELWQTLDEETVRRGRVPSPGAAADQHDLRLDVAEALAGLSREDRGLCEWLRHHTVTETARGTGLSGASLWRRMGALRARFVTAGLGAHIPAGRRADPRARE